MINSIQFSSVSVPHRPLQVSQRLRGVLSSKMQGYEDLLGKLVADACIKVCPANQFNFNVDNVRVCKLAGGALGGSKVVKGMVLKRSVEGSVT